MKTWQVTIDGPAASGKTFVAQWLAPKLQAIYIDTGVHYRAFTWWCNYKKINPTDTTAVEEAINTFSVIITQELVTINDIGVKPITLGTTSINTVVGKLAALPFVRVKLTKIQRQAALLRNTIMVGRDAGTVILPNADCKIFMTASLDVRAQRRYSQDKGNGLNVDLNIIKNKIIDRDYKDSHRSIAPLKPAADAIIVDNSTWSTAETLERVLKLVQNKLHQNQ